MDLPSRSRNDPRPSGLRLLEIGSPWNALQRQFQGVLTVLQTMTVLWHDRSRRSRRIRNLPQVEQLMRSLSPKRTTVPVLQTRAGRFPVSVEHPRPWLLQESVRRQILRQAQEPRFRSHRVIAESRKATPDTLPLLIGECTHEIPNRVLRLGNLPRCCEPGFSSGCK